MCLFVSKARREQRLCWCCFLIGKWQSCSEYLWAGVHFVQTLAERPLYATFFKLMLAARYLVTHVFMVYQNVYSVDSPDKQSNCTGHFQFEMFCFWGKPTFWEQTAPTFSLCCTWDLLNLYIHKIQQTDVGTCISRWNSQSTAWPKPQTFWPAFKDITTASFNIFAVVITKFHCQ